MFRTIAQFQKVKYVKFEDDYLTEIVTQFSSLTGKQAIRLFVSDFAFKVEARSKVKELRDELPSSPVT